MQVQHMAPCGDPELPLLELPLIRGKTHHFTTSSPRSRDDNESEQRTDEADWDSHDCPLACHRPTQS